MHALRVMALGGVLFICGIARAGVVDLDFVAISINGENVFGDLFDDPNSTPAEYVFPFGQPGPEANGLLTFDNLDALAIQLFSSPEEEVGFNARMFAGDLPLDRYILISFQDDFGNRAGVAIGNNFAVASDPDNYFLGDIVYVGTTEFEINMSITAATGQFDVVINDTTIFSGMTAFQGNPVIGAEIAVVPEPTVLTAFLLAIPVLIRRR